MQELAMRIWYEPTGDDNDAIMISPEQLDSDPKKLFVRLDYKSCEYILRWPRRSPRPQRLPAQDAQLESVEHDEQMAEIWMATMPMAYGSYSMIRRSKDSTEALPVYKLANGDEGSRQMIENEYILLKSMATLNLPVVRASNQQLRDDNGIFGFTMEELIKIEYTQVLDYIEQMGEALRKLHAAGFVHGDFSFSNVMLKSDGDVILIDVGGGGRIGQKTEKWHPSHYLMWWEGKEKHERRHSYLTPEVDWEAFERMKQRLLRGPNSQRYRASTEDLQSRSQPGRLFSIGLHALFALLTTYLLLALYSLIGRKEDLCAE